MGRSEDIIADRFPVSLGGFSKSRALLAGGSVAKTGMAWRRVR
jgi:hypothetical protein